MRVLFLLPLLAFLFACASGPSAGDENQKKASDKKTAKQDLLYNFSPSISDFSPPFTFKNQPAWLHGNPEDGSVNGYPPQVGTTEGVTILDANENIVSFFDIEVVGDPLTEYAWHLQNRGQKTFSMHSGKQGEDMHIVDAIRMGITGKNARIALSDDGLELLHEDLAENIIQGASRNYRKATPYGGDPTPLLSEDGHGTAVAGLIGAKGWNGHGARGVAPDAKLMGFNFLASDVDYKDSILLNQVTPREGSDFDILNQSWGSAPPQDCKLPVEYHIESAEYVAQLKSLALRGRQGKGAVVVKAAGNEFYNCPEFTSAGALKFWTTYPMNASGDCSYPYMVCVGALDSNGVKASYSSTGSSMWVSGLGGESGFDHSVNAIYRKLENIYRLYDPALISTDLTSCSRGFSPGNGNSFDSQNTDLNPGCNYTSTMSGTSGATPTVSGVVALMMEANPNLTWRDVKYILAKTATQVDVNISDQTRPWDPPGYIYEPKWITNAAGFKFHNWYGFGRVDALEAIKLAKNYSQNLGNMIETTDSAGNWIHMSENLYLNIPDFNSLGVSSSLNVAEDLVVETVQVKIKIDHPFAGDIGIELISPAGTKSVLMNVNNALTEDGLDDIILLSNAFYGERTAGNWTVHIVDGMGDVVGKLIHWGINFTCHL